MSIRRLLHWFPAAVLLAVLLVGCGGSSSSQAMLSGASWPGITVEGDVIYVAAGARVFAVDPQTAGAVWVYPEENRRASLFFAAPAVRDDLVVVADYASSLFALDRENGAERWAFVGGARFIGGAAIGEQYVYAGAVDGTLYALDRENGAEAWTFEAERDIWATPLLDEPNNVLYVVSLDRHLYALDATSGDLLWQYPARGETVEPAMGAIANTPSLYDGVLYFGSFNNYLYALDTETHQVLWTYPTDNWVWGSPVLDEVSGLLIGGDLDGHVFALDPATGAEVWTFSAEGPVVGTPAPGDLANGTRVVYVTSADMRLYVLNVEDGSRADTPVQVDADFQTRFLFIQTGTTSRPVPLYAPPVLYDDLILLGMHEGSSPLIALDRETLLERWAFEPPAS